MEFDEANTRRKNPFLDENNRKILNSKISSSPIKTPPSIYSTRKKNDGNEFDEDDRMAASYSEIAFPTNYENSSNETKTYHSIKKKEDANETNSHEDKTESSSCEDKNTSPNSRMKWKSDAAAKRPISLVCDNSFPYNLEGTVSKDGDLTNFVAENLEYKIKISSPVTKKDYPGLSSSRNSTPSTSGLISKQFLLPQQLLQIDSNVLNDIEIEAQYLAASVDNLTENLCNLLHSISSITTDNVEIHKNAVKKLTDSMDANIKSMYTIMAKTEEISKSMKPTEQLAQRIREIKRLVDMLESNL